MKEFLIILCLISTIPFEIVYSEEYQGGLGFSDLYGREIAEVEYKVIIKDYVWEKTGKHKGIEKIIMSIKNLDNGTVLNASAYFPNLWYEKVDYSGTTYDGMCVWIPDQSPLNRDRENTNAEEYMVYPQKTKEYTLTYKDQYIAQSYGDPISYSLFCDKLLKKDLYVFIGVSPDMRQKAFRLRLNKIK